MPENQSHNGDPEFEEFFEQEMGALAERAEKQDICMDCLTDRILVEMVASLMRSGVSTPDILNMVADGMALAEEAEGGGGNGRHGRMH